MNEHSGGFTAQAEGLSFCQRLSSFRKFETENDVIENVQFLNGYLGKWMHDRGFKTAALMMDLMLEKTQDDHRKDEVTPKSLHMLTQAIWFISCLEDGLHVDDPEGVLALIFAHDLGEDYGVTPEDTEAYLTQRSITDRGKIDQLKEDFDVITKRYGKDGEPQYENDYKYHYAVQQNQNASVAKMFDRAHNVMTMVGVMSAEKTRDYVSSTMVLQRDYVRDTSLLYPDQEEIYDVMQHLITDVIQISRYDTQAHVGKPLDSDFGLHFAMPQKGFKDMPAGLHPYVFLAERVRKAHPGLHSGGASFAGHAPDGQSPA